MFLLPYIPVPTSPHPLDLFVGIVNFAMQNLESRSIQIAGDAVDYVAPTGKSDLSRWETREKEVEGEEEDERDVRRKQTFRGRYLLWYAFYPGLCSCFSIQGQPNPIVPTAKLMFIPLAPGSHTNPLASSTATSALPPSTSTLQPSPLSPATMTSSAPSP